MSSAKISNLKVHFESRHYHLFKNFKIRGDIVEFNGTSRAEQYDLKTRCLVKLNHVYGEIQSVLSGGELFTIVNFPEYRLTNGKKKIMLNDVGELYADYYVALIKRVGVNTLIELYDRDLNKLCNFEERMYIRRLATLTDFVIMLSHDRDLYIRSIPYNYSYNLTCQVDDFCVDQNILYVLTKDKVTRYELFFLNFEYFSL
jgi:hypothetical protein